MKPNHSCEKCAPKIGVVIPARNESDNIANTLYALTHQTVPPHDIIVVNDGSTDDTKEICVSMGVDVIDFPYEHDNWVAQKEIAKVFNVGLCHLCDDLDYVTILGSDEVLPSGYFDYITKHMDHDNVTIASGQITGESNDIPRGSGRIVRYDWWKDLGLKYPVNYGFETWLIAKCIVSGNKIKVYPKMQTDMQRKTGANYGTHKYLFRGYAYKALGYNKRYVLLKFLLMIIRCNTVRQSFKMIKGYMSYQGELYEDSVREYYDSLQKDKLKPRNFFRLAKRIWQGY